MQFYYSNHEAKPPGGTEILIKQLTSLVLPVNASAVLWSYGTAPVQTFELSWQVKYEVLVLQKLESNPSQAHPRPLAAAATQQFESDR